MADQTAGTEDELRLHTVQLREMLTRVVEHARHDVATVSDPRTRALFEATADVCQYLVTAMEHEEQKVPAWQR
ncbi:hypothetical protein [Nonomuraea jabiensis]|uniref:hypothetical protein n=1 Tax=Nonomuraea jabiensis TaxID=882448 RepID=UPI003D72BE3C